MNESTEPNANVEKANPETPWEFIPDDETFVEELSLPAEEAALHVVDPDGKAPLPRSDPPVTVHYMDDEEPEVPDVSQIIEREEVTPEVDALLIRQHYIDPTD